MLLRREKSRIVELLEQTSNELTVKGDCPTLRQTVEEEQAAEEQCAVKSKATKACRAYNVLMHTATVVHVEN